MLAGTFARAPLPAAPAGGPSAEAAAGAAEAAAGAAWPSEPG